MADIIFKKPYLNIKSYRVLHKQYWGMIAGSKFMYKPALYFAVSTKTPNTVELQSTRHDCLACEFALNNSGKFYNKCRFCPIKKYNDPTYNACNYTTVPCMADPDEPYMRWKDKPTRETALEIADLEWFTQEEYDKLKEELKK